MTNVEMRRVGVMVIVGALLLVAASPILGWVGRSGQDKQEAQSRLEQRDKCIEAGAYDKPIDDEARMACDLNDMRLRQLGYLKAKG